MSFFSDLSPIGKGAIALAAVFLLYLGFARVVGMAPFSEDKGISRQRGVAGQDR